MHHRINGVDEKNQVPERTQLQAHLHEELEVDVIRLGRRAPSLLALTSGDEIDTLKADDDNVRLAEAE